MPVAWISLAVGFWILAKSADFFVDSSVGIAIRFRIPRLVIGIVLVSLATTAPELTVSLLASIKGHPEIALGNAVGSVICDDTLALGLCAVLAPAAIPVIPRVLKMAGIFLFSVAVLLTVFVAHNGMLTRIEGIILLALFAGYIAFIYRDHKTGKYEMHVEAEISEKAVEKSTAALAGLFLVSLVMLIFASDVVVSSATFIARGIGISEAVIALTLVALGTSIPEIATCITAARKNEGALAIGNILGADIMNICWVAGASAVANDLVLQPQEINFMFPAMLIVVSAMLIMLRHRYTLTRRKGFVLLALYVLYIAGFAFFLKN